MPTAPAPATAPTEPSAPVPPTETTAPTAPARRFWPSGRRLVVELVGLPALVVAVLWLAQDRLVFLPTHELPPVAAALPGAEDVTYPTDDGITEHGWFLAARPNPSTPRCGGDGDDGRPTTVVVFHGNLGTRATMAPYAAGLAAHGCNVLLAEYRGYAEVAGDPSEDGLRSDAEAALAYVTRRPDVDPDRIAYAGHSLGTGVATALATAHPPRALVLLAPFTSLPDVAWSRLPVLPYDRLMRARFATIERLPSLHVPVLIVGGDEDHLIPPEHSVRLFGVANEPKRLVMIPGADHDLAAPGGPDLAALTASWVAEHR